MISSLFRADMQRLFAMQAKSVVSPQFFLLSTVILILVRDDRFRCLNYCENELNFSVN